MTMALPCIHCNDAVRHMMSGREARHSHISWLDRFLARRTSPSEVLAREATNQALRDIAEALDEIGAILANRMTR